MNIWRLIVHHENPELAMRWVRQEQRIAIGWGKVGDLTKWVPRDAAQIGERIRSFYPELQNSGDGGASLWNLLQLMHPGDLVVLRGKGVASVVVEIEGEYDYADSIPSLWGKILSGEYLHQRKVKVTQLDPEAIAQRGGGDVAPGYSKRRTLFLFALQQDGEPAKAAKQLPDTSTSPSMKAAQSGISGLELELLHQLLRLTKQGKIQWQKQEGGSDEFEAKFNSKRLWVGFKYLERTDGEGADRTLAKISAYGCLIEFCIGTEGFNLIVEMLAWCDENWWDGWQSACQRLTEGIEELKAG